jgi:hypothetical protein
MPDIRVRLATLLRRRGWKGDIHLLGASPEYPTEINDHFHNVRKLRIRSTDTSSPFNYAFNGALLIKPHAGIRRPDAYFEQPYDAFDLEILDKNVDKLQRWCADRWKQ